MKGVTVFMDEYLRKVLKGVYDYFEDEVEDHAVGVPVWKLDDEVIDNIKFLLERYGLFDEKRMRVIIPAGATYDVSCREIEPGSGVQQCIISQGFEIFDETGNEILAYGSAYTTYYAPSAVEKPGAELVDVARTLVRIPAEGVRRLWQYLHGKLAIRT